MKKLIQGIVDFRKNLTDENRKLFAQLALGQKPDTLFIACSDSRVVPNLFASTNPGDLFVLRNVGNLIPPASDTMQDGAAAVIEFAVVSLGVSDIIICGHSECGAMQALSDGDDRCCPRLASWLKHGEESLSKMRQGQTLDPLLSEHNQLSQMNVLQQMEHLRTYSSVLERLETGRLRIHGWWFDIAQADIYCYEKDRRRFIVIDETEAESILERIL